MSRTPIPHHLQETGVGDVVPAEILQRGVEFQRQAVRDLVEHHQHGEGETLTHAGPTWATASAGLDVEILEHSPAYPSALVWAMGFAPRGAPVLRHERRYERVGFEGPHDVRVWLLRWTLPTEGRQSVQVGFGVNDELVTPHNEALRFEQRGAEGILRIAAVPDVNPLFIPAYYAALRRVYLLIRVME